MSPHVYEEKQFDETDHKKKQRERVGDLLASCESILLTNCPTKISANWIQGLKDTYPHKRFTLVDNQAFKKGWLPEFDKLKKTDIFSAVFTNPAELVWADLYGGLAAYAKVAIERSEVWRHFVLTMSNVYRGPVGGAIPKGQSVLSFMDEWCQLSGWQFEMIGTPYQHRNKASILKQLVDKRSPWYYTFHIAR